MFHYVISVQLYNIILNERYNCSPSASDPLFIATTLSHPGTVTSFLTAEKASMREKALLFLQTYYTSELGQIFDRFVDSTEDFILGNKPLCGLEELIPELAFSVFWPFVKRVYPELNTTSPAYQECAKQFVNDRYTTNIEETRRSFEQPLLRVARLFQYRNALLSTVSALEREDLSEACLVDLVAAQYCEGCSGMHSEASDTCLLQCKSAVGSCLKPFEALSDIIRDWGLYGRELSEAVTTFNPDYMFSSVPWRILDIAADVTLPGSTVKAEVGWFACRRCTTHTAFMCVHLERICCHYSL